MSLIDSSKIKRKNKLEIWIQTNKYTHISSAYSVYNQFWKKQSLCHYIYFYYKMYRRIVTFDHGIRIQKPQKIAAQQTRSKNPNIKLKYTSYYLNLNCLLIFQIQIYFEYPIEKKEFTEGKMKFWKRKQKLLVRWSKTTMSVNTCLYDCHIS